MTRAGRGLPPLLRGFLLLALALVFFPGRASAQELIQEIQIHGNRRIPAETIRARIFSRAGDVYDEAALQRDFHSLWNTGFFEEIRFEREEAPKGWRIHIYVKEKPTIRAIEYKGLNSVSVSDVLDRYKERKVGLTVENQYDPTKIKKAEVVLKELLSEHGRQFATIRSEVRPIPPASVGVTFVVKEGPKVKVGSIKFEGNKHIGSRELRRAMKNLKPIGIPHSIVLEGIISKTFDATKLSEDAERVRGAYQTKGYFKALIEDPKTKVRDTGGIRIPLIRKGGGKAVDITIPIEEGERYRLGGITFKNNKAIRDVRLLRTLFPMKDGDIFNVDNVRKGLENLRKGYGELGYINFTSVPDTQIDDDKKLIHLEIDLDEGKPFYIRRIEFVGNQTTRDKVIRRELAVEEGGIFNSRLWEFSILRLNQLGYFEQLKPEEDSERHLNEKEGTVDLTLKVKEKGRNSVGLTGGVSGLSGSFIGASYETNNFLGLGETLRIEANIGDLERNVLFGFTEPYMFDRPLQFGFTVYARKFNYNQARQAAIQQGVPLNVPNALLDLLQNYNTSSKGFTTSLSYPLKRSLKRVGLTYSYDSTSVTVFSDASRSLFEQLAFRGIAGPAALNGVTTSKILTTFSLSTIDNPLRPHRGRSYFVGGEFAGVGGNVRYIRPIVEVKYFRPMNKDRNTLGVRLQGSFMTGYAGRVAPPFQRFYIGGDTDLRGFDIRAVSPVAFLVDRVDFPLLNPDGTAVPKDPTNLRRGNWTVPIPVQHLIFPGGDTSLISNVEYRVPLVGPVTLAAFNDFGLNVIARPSQLKVNSTQLADLNTNPFGCPALDASFNCTGGVSLTFPPNLLVVDNTNFVPRMSTGLEVQVVMPVVNAPFRIYYAFNPLRMNTTADSPVPFTREMFPVGGAGDYSYQQALRAFGPTYRLRDPRTTLRFTVSTTF